MHIIGNDWKADVNFINDNPNKLLVNQQYELSSIGLVSRYCKVFFLTLVNFITLATWQKSINLASHHWKEIKSGKAKCRAVIETPLFKNLKLVSGKLEKIDDFANELAQDEKFVSEHTKRNAQDLKLVDVNGKIDLSPMQRQIPPKRPVQFVSRNIKSEILPENRMHKTFVDKPNLLELFPGIIRLVNSFLETDERENFLTTNKQMKAIIEEHAKIECFPINNIINKMMNYLDINSKVRKKLSALLKDDLFEKYPAMDIGLRDVLICNKVQKIIKKTFKNDKRFQTDKEIVMYLLKTDHAFLKYASDELKEDPEAVFGSLYWGDEAVKYAGPNIKNNRELLLLKSKETQRNYFQYAAENLRNDREVYLKLCEFGCSSVLHKAPTHIKHDKDVILAAVKNNYWELFSAHIYNNESLNNRAFLLEVVKINGLALYWITRHHNDFDFVLEAVKQNPKAIQYADKRLQEYFFRKDVIKFEGVNLDSLKKPEDMTGDHYY
ncbi:MAG: DUF4116 domain-containing protein [Parachlamydiaceae bacterium]|nr:DUF4116 domain-containing protein [Parachlamydiaceae bacterium]